MRERAVRLVLECRDDHPSEWAAMKSVAAKLGMTPEAVCANGSAKRRTTLAAGPG